MATQVGKLHTAKRLFNVDEYHRIGEIGILNEDDRVELIEGELVMPHGAGERHARYVPRLYTYIRMLTADEYERIIEAGILSGDESVELIEGEVIQMSPIGKRHAAYVDRIDRLLHKVVGNDTIVRTQGPVRIDQYSQLQPDIALLRFRPDFYAESLPLPGDTLLLIEVSDTTLAMDRQGKLPLYARAGIPEVWIVNIVEDVVELYSDPLLSTYQASRRVGRGTPLTLPVSGRPTFDVAALLGESPAA